MRNRYSVITVVLIPVMAVTAHAERAPEVAGDANSVSVRVDGATLLRYRYANVAFKPYVQELFTPNGVNVLLDSPPDHVHHHGLMFACAVNGVDFWGESVGQTGDRAADKLAAIPGKQVHRRLGATAPFAVMQGPLHAPFTEFLDWSHESQKEPLLVERRTVMARLHGEPKATLVTWACELAVPEGKESATLTGSHYHGLGMRFVRSMDANGEFRNPDNNPGVIFRGEERLARSRWCAYTAQVDGKPVTVAIFDDPNNPRHPATWFMMAKPFAYLSATMRLHEEPLKVLTGKPLKLRYGVALSDGRLETAQIDSLYKQWTAMTQAGTDERKQ